jgi:hypothetical protein
VLEESIEAVRLGEQRQDRVEGHLRAQIPTWSLFPLVQRDRLKPGGWYGAGWQRPTGRAR